MQMGYSTTSLKYKRPHCMMSRFQIDAVCLVKTQINPSLRLCTFSTRNKLFKNKESVSILLQNKQELLGMRQQDRASVGIIG